MRFEWNELIRKMYVAVTPAPAGFVAWHCMQVRFDVTQPENLELEHQTISKQTV